MASKTYCFIIALIICCGLVSAEGSTFFYASSQALAVKDYTGDVSYLYQDRLGSDINTKSLPFGQVISSADRFGFTGKEQDASGLHYFAARYYDSSIGRFTRVDPNPSEPSYQYVGNNPLNYVDPTGKTRKHAIKETINSFADVFIRYGPRAVQHLEPQALTSNMYLKTIYKEANLLLKHELRKDYFIKNMELIGNNIPDSWKRLWESHSREVFRITQKIAGDTNVEPLPDNYLHDISKAFRVFEYIDALSKRVDKLLDEGHITLVEHDQAIDTLIPVFQKYHSAFEYHHLNNLDELSPSQLRTHILEHIVDHFHTSIIRFGKSSETALKEYTDPEGRFYKVYEKAVELTSPEFVNERVNLAVKEISPKVMKATD